MGLGGQDGGDRVAWGVMGPICVQDFVWLTKLHSKSWIQSGCLGLTEEVSGKFRYQPTIAKLYLQPCNASNNP